MGVALLAAKRSKDPSTQVGACIVDKNNVILSTGYNGFPKGCSDDEFPWDREGEDTKYPYVVHAELNAILNAQGKSLVGSKIYVALFPCNECAKAIIQAGIKEVVYLSDKYADTAGVKASKLMLSAAGVKMTCFDSDIENLVLNFISEKSEKTVKEEKGMTLHEFCRTKTQALEFCVIKEEGWIVASVWIDYEDLFMLPEKLQGRIVKKDYWEELPIVNEKGEKIRILCHAIEII